MSRSLLFPSVLVSAGATLVACPSAVQESDPVYAAAASSGISSSDVDRWNAAAEEPQFTASTAAGIGADDVTRWDTALSTETDPVFAASPAGGIADDDIVRWNAAASVRAQRLNVNATEFITRTPTTDLDYLGGQGIRFAAGVGGARLLAAVHLPDGAQVTDLACVVRDNDATQSIIAGSRAQLNAAGMPDFGDGFTVIAEVPLETAGEGGVVFESRAPFADAVIDNAANQYFVSVDITLEGVDAEFFDPLFRGCSIGYIAR